MMGVKGGAPVYLLQIGAEAGDLDQIETKIQAAIPLLTRASDVEQVEKTAAKTGVRAFAVVVAPSDEAEYFAKVMGVIQSWWSPEQIGYIGGIGGSLIGCLGALIGCLAGLGKARCFVLASTRISIGLGLALTIAGLIALLGKQPYAVWFPLVLTGGILTFVLAVNLYPIKRRYDDQEIRRMTSLDATGG